MLDRKKRKKKKETKENRNATYSMLCLIAGLILAIIILGISYLALNPDSKSSIINLDVDKEHVKFSVSTTGVNNLDADEVNTLNKRTLNVAN